MYPKDSKMYPKDSKMYPKDSKMYPKDSIASMNLGINRCTW